MPFTYYTQSQISPLGGIGRHVCLRSISSGESSSLSEGTMLGWTNWLCHHTFNVEIMSSNLIPNTLKNN